MEAFRLACEYWLFTLIALYMVTATLVRIFRAVFQAGRARAIRCPKCGFSNVVEVVKASKEEDDDE